MLHRYAHTRTHARTLTYAQRKTRARTDVPSEFQNDLLRCCLLLLQDILLCPLALTVSTQNMPSFMCCVFPHSILISFLLSSSCNSTSPLPSLESPLAVCSFTVHKKCVELTEGNCHGALLRQPLQMIARTISTTTGLRTSQASLSQSASTDSLLSVNGLSGSDSNPPSQNGSPVTSRSTSPAPDLSSSQSLSPTPTTATTPSSPSSSTSSSSSAFSPARTSVQAQMHVSSHRRPMSHTSSSNTLNNNDSNSDNTNLQSATRTQSFAYGSANSSPDASSQNSFLNSSYPPPSSSASGTATSPAHPLPAPHAFLARLPSDKELRRRSYISTSRPPYPGSSQSPSSDDLGIKIENLLLESKRLEIKTGVCQSMLLSQLLSISMTVTHAVSFLLLLSLLLFCCCSLLVTVLLIIVIMLLGCCHVMC